MSKPATSMPAPDTRRYPACPRLPGPGETLTWSRLYGDGLALFLALAMERHPGPLLILAPELREAEQLAERLGFFAGPDAAVSLLPDWETLPYDRFSPHPDILSRRLQVLSRLPDQRRGAVVTTLGTALQRLAPVDYVLAHAFSLQVGDRLDIDRLRTGLERAGYRCVSQVMERGEYAVRGSLFDLFPMGAEAPVRIDLFDDEIESLRRFDPDSQRSLESCSRVELLPAREFPLTEEAIARFRRAYRNRFEGNLTRHPVYRDISAGAVPGGIEYYLPLFFDHTARLADYLPSDTLVVELPDTEAGLARLQADILERHAARRDDPDYPVLPPEALFLTPDELAQSLAGHGRLRLQRFAAAPDAPVATLDQPTAPLPELGIRPRSQDPSAQLRAFVQETPHRILFTAESPGRREALLQRLRDLDLKPRPTGGWADFLQGDMPLGLAVAPLEDGLVLPEAGIAIVPEARLLGQRVRQRSRRRGRDPETLIRELNDLRPGAPVVHEDHGVGRYLGLQRLVVEGTEMEFLALEYADGDKLYVPVSALHLISRYSGGDLEQVPLHKLGSDQWQRARRKAAERIRDVAAELLEVQARRAARPGTAYPVDTPEYRQFADTFPFEETPDQQAAIEAVLADLAAPHPMDRVVCGDVGFGKTEVAMRAAFTVASAGRQVAVLVPTTLLAQQHFQTFSDRMADWPLRVAALSRFRSRKEQNRILQELADGQVDIVIGTHKLLQSDVRFNDLGLVIIDEEHRFGVRQKERFKALRAEVDLLTLTATPIPRTMNMALSGLRDLSVIATPPPQRMAIKTFVCQWDRATLREACLREIKRGGQVYFLHNEVETIERVARELAELVPEAAIGVGHGQMRESELERVMLDFYHRRFNVLVCTTIIESGIDIPTANTIVINRADRLGLAQLHQLRGRVGRSHHRAYAYLVVPPRQAMTPDAVKRLEAIESMEELGSGFSLATHDLEIRGAGELLGEEQSGQIQQIGFALYNELLERTVRALRDGREVSLDEPLHHGPEIDLHLPALIPEDYLPDVHMRLILYKRIANAPDEAALDGLQVEMIDRFGLLPQPLKQLFAVTALKLQAQPLGIRKIDAGQGGGSILFEPQPPVDPARVIALVQAEPQRFRITASDRLRFQYPAPDLAPADRIDWLRALLRRLTGTPGDGQ